MFSVHIDTARSWRGGQNQVLLTVLGLRARGHRAALVAHPEGELRRRASDGLDLFPLAPRAEMDLAAAWQLSRILRQLQPDIVHAHDAHGIAFAGLALSLSGAHVHARFIASRRVDFHVGHNAFSRWKYRQVEHFICASEAIRNMLVNDGVPTGRTGVVYEGVDLERLTTTPTVDLHRELWLPHGAPVVVNVAALVPHKGQRYLIQAAAEIMRTLPDARFVIVGAGELETTLEKQIHRLNLEKHVFLTGFRPDAISLLKSADVFVMSSVTEGLGTSVLDAMGCARPVVATRAGGLPEVVDDGLTGTLVPIRDPTTMAAAIARLLEDASLGERYGRAGLARVRERFSADRMIDETAALYERLAGTSLEEDSRRRAGAD